MRVIKYINIDGHQMDWFFDCVMLNGVGFPYNWITSYTLRIQTIKLV